jgi:GT2 family glycosyltransferase
MALTASIIIPNWNGRHFLAACLEALAKQTRSDFEVIVVDNGSADGSVELLESRFPHVKVVSLPENRGFAAAMNVGIRRAAGRYVAFLNNDTEPEPEWLEELIACLERHSRAAAATSKMVFADDTGVIDDTGDLLTSTFLPYARGHGERDTGQYETEQEVLSASGGAALWQAEALSRIGLFAAQFFAYYEDVDLGLRAQLAGYECWYAPRAVVNHKRGGSVEADSDFALRHHVRNRWLMLVRTIPGPLLVRALPQILRGEATWWARAAHARRPVSLLRAYAGVARELPRALAERRTIQSGRARDAGELRGLLRALAEREPSTH